MTPFAKRCAMGTTLAVGMLLVILLNAAYPNGIVIWGLGTVLALLSAWELGRMEGLRDWRLSPALVVAAIATAVVVWVARFDLTNDRHPWLVLPAAAAVAAVVAGGLAAGARRPAALVALWAIVPLIAGLSIYQGWGTRGLGVLVVFSKIGDIFGYFVGRKIGRRHPFPTLSPGKTVAGCVASLVAGVVAGVVMAALDALPTDGAGLLAGALAGALLNLAAQAGDLFESWVKRRAKVKDSSALLGPAGGVLDVVDSVLFTIPVSLVLWPWLFPPGLPV